MSPKWSCACALARALHHDGAEHCRLFDPRPHAPDWLAPRQYRPRQIASTRPLGRHDRDTKYTTAFRAIIESGQVKTLPLPARSPSLNAYAERWVRSAKEECLSKIILFGERSLRRALGEYVAHYHVERNHQGNSNVLLFPLVSGNRRDVPVQCRERLGGLRFYHRAAA